MEEDTQTGSSLIPQTVDKMAEDLYFQNYKILLLQSYNKVEVTHLLCFLSGIPGEAFRKPAEVINGDHVTFLRSD